MKRHEPEQLNKPAASEEYQLEDILREFGAKSEPPTPFIPDDTTVFQPVQTADGGAREDIKLAKPKKKRQKPAPKLSDETQRLPTLTELRKAAAHTEQSPAAESASATQPLSAPQANTASASPRKRSSAPRKYGKHQSPAAAASVDKTRPLVPSDTPPVPKAMLAKCREGLGALRFRMGLLVFLALASLFLLFYQAQSWAFLPISSTVAAWLSILMLLSAVLLSPEVLQRGIGDLLHLRAGLYTPAVVSAVLALIHAVHTRNSGVPAYCAAVILLFCSLLRAILLEKTALVHTLRTVSSFDAPMGVFDTPQLLKDSDSLRRDTGDTGDFMQHLTQPDRPQKFLRVYTAMLLPISGILAFLLSRHSETGFVLSWLLLLLGGIPFAAMLSYFRPFAVLAKRLSAFGGALCGWYSAKIFGGHHTIILRDEDLFPRASIASNGMKLYGANKAPRVIAYTLAALDTIGSPLTGVFEALLQSQYGKHYHAVSYRCYDNGGIGAEIAGDVVLVGSLSFMRGMGVHMPEGTRVRQAVYTSVNGELAGIFAMKYKPNASTRAGLHDILANRNFSVVLATRDFLITPELIAAKYELVTDSIQFPAFDERIRLSASDPNEASEQGALIAKDTFGAFASTVAAGNTLRITSLFSVWMCLFSGFLGLILCTLTIIWDSLASPMHIVAFQLLWAIASSFVSWILLKR